MKGIRGLDIQTVEARKYEQTKLYNFSPAEEVITNFIPVEEAVMAISADIETTTISGIFAVLYVGNKEALQVISLDEDVLKRENVREFLAHYVSIGPRPEIVRDAKAFLRSYRYEFNINGVSFWAYSSIDCAEIAAVEDGKFRRLCVSEREFPSLVKLLRAFGLKV